MNVLSNADPLRCHDHTPAMKIATMERSVEKLQWQRDKLPLSYKSRISCYRIEMGTRLLLAEIWIAQDELSKAEIHIKHVQGLASRIGESEISTNKCFQLLERIQEVRNRVISDEGPLSLE